jgi:hypothetical protein
MTIKQSAAGHHASAASHHKQAAQFHREASRHYQIGKDYGHAAHEALTAHGHALRALADAQAARASYPQPAGGPSPFTMARSAARAAPKAVGLVMGTAAHHVVAAEHHEAARRHHAEATTHCEAGQSDKAAQETNYALEHARNAISHGDQAAMHHSEHYGCHPSPELV